QLVAVGSTRQSDDLLGRIAAENQHVQVLDRDPVDLGVGALQVSQQRVVVGIVRFARHVRTGTHGAVGVVDEIAQSDQGDLVPAVHRGAREADGGVVVLLGRNVVDDEAELDRRGGGGCGVHAVSFGAGTRATLWGS